MVFFRWLDLFHHGFLYTFLQSVFNSFDAGFDGSKPFSEFGMIMSDQRILGMLVFCARGACDFFQRMFRRFFRVFDIGFVLEFMRCLYLRLSQSFGQIFVVMLVFMLDVYFSIGHTRSLVHSLSRMDGVME